MPQIAPFFLFHKVFFGLIILLYLIYLSYIIIVPKILSLQTVRKYLSL